MKTTHEQNRVIVTSLIISVRTNRIHLRHAEPIFRIFTGIENFSATQDDRFKVVMEYIEDLNDTSPSHFFVELLEEIHSY